MKAIFEKKKIGMLKKRGAAPPHPPPPPPRIAHLG